MRYKPESMKTQQDHFQTKSNLILTPLRQNLIIYYDRLIVNGDEVEIKDWVSLEGDFSKITYLREAMGFGDVKFMAMIGIFVGWQGVLFTLFMASIIGTIISLPSKFINRDSVLNRVPFGPFLSIGSLIWIFCGPELLKRYLLLIAEETIPKSFFMLFMNYQKFNERVLWHI